MLDGADFTPDPTCSPWWIGYMRGLGRAALGVDRGSQAEHELLLADIGSPDPDRRAMANGYRAGLKRLFHSGDAE